MKNDIDEAEKTLRNVKAGEDLRSAIRRRHLGDLEKSMAHIRKNGWEKDWGIELKEGEKLANRLRRLEKLKAEIMELKQSVISEIRSYQNPPPAVHKVCVISSVLTSFSRIINLVLHPDNEGHLIFGYKYHYLIKHAS